MNSEEKAYPNKAWPTILYLPKLFDRCICGALRVLKCICKSFDPTPIKRYSLVLLPIKWMNRKWHQATSEVVIKSDTTSAWHSPRTHNVGGLNHPLRHPATLKPSCWKDYYGTMHHRVREITKECQLFWVFPVQLPDVWMRNPWRWLQAQLSPTSNSIRDPGEEAS